MTPTETAEAAPATGRPPGGRGPRRLPLTIVLAAILFVIIAIGAGLQGRFVFTGPRWIPSGVGIPIQKISPPPHTQAPATAPAAPTATPPVVISWWPILVVLGALVVAAVLLAVIVWLRRRARERANDVVVVDDVVGNATPLVDSDPELPTLRRGLALAAERLDEDRLPRDAIVQAWLGLQEAAEDSGVRRRPAETPTEFTSRVFAAVDADRDAAARLLDVYLRVRFGTKPATAADLAIAREAIERLRATWPTGALG